MEYYVIEGIDTSGKTTQCNLIRQNFHCVKLDDYKDSMQDAIVLLNEPGATGLGGFVREILLDSQTKVNERSAFLLFLAQRAELFLRIKNIPNTIIADRSLISGVAYAQTINMYEALRFNLFATGGVLPKKIVFLESSKDTLEDRLNQKRLDSIEQRGIQYLLDVQEYFKEILACLQAENTLYDLYKSVAQECDLDSKSIQSIYKPEVLILDSALPKEEIHKKICIFFGI
ncbi:dTMP kinase [Helicobacter trogontum]|uniref:Thymidylate kinase n=1 Tax=Helicobacter trogontum TaxID=50960 RepID=A0A4U8TH04_9HELI|nr:dTMP kinase [Helicobacter trogontum]MCI5786921.1 dTMP kinase [Helicobacter trogontum]MDY5185667.1 dTMP kinase [Helicobacter trogontum]TLD99491.1 dTMP kinase [Helicobacter trogontum]